MKLSTKARHAITAMMDLALNDKTRPVTLAEISQCQGISLSYLEQLFAKLRKSGLVIGVRGPGGGYKLSRSPNEISVANIITAIDEYSPRQIPTGFDQQEQGLEKKYVTQVMWDELSEKIYGFLNGITLEEFAKQPENYTPSETSTTNTSIEQETPAPTDVYSNRSAA